MAVHVDRDMADFTGHAARAQSARETVKQMLEALNLPKLTDPEFTVSLQPAATVVPLGSSGAASVA